MWIKYEYGKRLIQEQNLSPEEYEKAIKNLLIEIGESEEIECYKQKEF